MACGLTFALALLVLMPTTGDFGVTYDEPAYRYSQMVSVQWWERLAQVRSADDLKPLLEPDALLYYWPYGRHGINFHPPLAGQLNLATYSLMGGLWKDIPARRLATVLEFALTVTVLFGFLARRYGAWVGASAAGCLLLMPRLYGQAHLIDTDVPGLWLWAMACVAFWNGLYAPKRGRWRIVLGILLGLAFVEKMGAVLVLLPILVWLTAARLPKAFRGPQRLSCWIDASLTVPVLLAPLALAFAEILRLKTKLPPPQFTDLFENRPASYLPGAILATPLLLWLIRRALARLFRTSAVWGTERPGLETLEAIIVFGPLVGWLGNPEWWRETMVRLTHYYMLNTARRGALPDILILYLGQTYKYSLPWHNAWVLMAITVPAAVLLMALVGLVWKLRACVRRSSGGGKGDWLRVFEVPVPFSAGAGAGEHAQYPIPTHRLRTARTDALPLFFLLNLIVLPVMRMLPTPAHDGVRLFLPSFFFLAAFAGWGVQGLSDLVARLARRPPRLVRAALLLLVLGDSAWQLWAIHPFELSYYNRLIGGPSGAWHRGFELTYWYDAFTPEVIDQLNRKLPEGAYVTFTNDLSSPSTFQELQSLGHLRSDLHLEAPPGDDYPYAWLLTHDSKATAQTRLLFALSPWFAVEPSQLDGARVASVADPESVATSVALQLLTDAPYEGPAPKPSAPEWVRLHAPWLARFWGDGLDRAAPLTLHEPTFAWVRSDPDSLRAAARLLRDRARSSGNRLPDVSENADAQKLLAILSRYDRPEYSFAAALLRKRPEALTRAVEILIRRPHDVRTVLTRYGFTDPRLLNGPLDAGLESISP